MSKYFSLFNTEAQYQAAKDTLDYPNVSLIDTTGDLHYAKYTGKTIANAAFGDIILASVADNSLSYIAPSAYNLTDYPLASYKPIAVCIFPAASHSAHQTIFLSTQYANSDGSGARNYYVDDLNGDYNLNTVQYSDGTESAEALRNYTNLIYSTSVTSVALKDALANYDKTHYPLLTRAELYHTPGTSAGDWYAPSYYDMSYMYSDSNLTTTVMNSLTTISTVTDNVYLDGGDNLFLWLWLGSEYEDYAPNAY